MTAASAGKAEKRERAEKREKGSRFRVRTALAALLLASLALMLWVYMYTGVLNVGEVEVRGNRRLDAGYLRALSGVTPRTHLLRMDVKAVERALLSEPYVAEARVSRRFPRTVILEVREKEPLGVVRQNGKYHLVDGEGMVLESRDEREDGLVEFPCRESRPLYPGVRLEDACFPQFAAVIRDMPEALREAAETVDFLEGEGLVLQAGGTRIILGGADELERKLEIAWLALQEMSPRYGRLEYIDVTYPDHPAIRPAE
jgi:cell division protein FtsQ